MVEELTLDAIVGWKDIDRCDRIRSPHPNQRQSVSHLELKSKPPSYGPSADEYCTRTPLFTRLTPESSSQATRNVMVRSGSNNYSVIVIVIVIVKQRSVSGCDTLQ